MSTISTMVSLKTFLAAHGKKALGAGVVVVVVLLSLDGDDDSTHKMSYQLFLEQPAPSPIPNGYGTVMLPHFVGQPGFAVFGVVIMVSGSTIVMARSGTSQVSITLNEMMSKDMV